MAFRILVQDPSAKVRSDLKAMLTPAGDPAAAVGGDSLSVLLEGAVAPPPGFPEVELEICQRLEAVEGLLKDGLKAGKPFAMVFLDPGPRDDGLALLERLRELDDEVFLVLQVVELFCHPIELMERVSPPDRLFVQHKPFHPFDIQQLVLSCFWRRQGGQETSLAKGADSEQTSGIEAGSSLWDRLPLGLAIFDRQERLLRVNAAFRDLLPELRQAALPGITYEAFQLEIARRLVPDDVLFRESAWLRDRMEWHAKAGSPLEQRLRGNRWLVMLEGNGPRGETYSFFCDVTDLKQREQGFATYRRVAQQRAILSVFCSELLMKMEGHRVERGSPGALENFFAVLSKCSAKAGAGSGKEIDLMAERLMGVLFPPPPDLRRLELGAFLQDYVSRREGTEDMPTSLVTSAGLWLVDCDSSRLATIMNELLQNARAASSPGAGVELGAENVRVNREFTISRPTLLQGDYVLLRVRDQGLGMSPDVCERALDPFFTTSASGEKFGLGLTSVFGFLEQMGGYLELESRPDEGTEVLIYLPRATGGPLGEKAGKRIAARGKGRYEGAGGRITLS